ncbi:MAG: tetratricopeptide repeat protein [Deltaproteobacteria bacterium]|nr:tetratricopeptide repeat protein [Deltaproteobacteria bacterium]
MKTILAIFLAVLLLLPVSALGEIQTITHTVKQPFGGSQSADDARIAAVAKAKREALEMAGVYVEALTIVKDAKVDKDEILALTAGVLKSEVVSQKNYVSGDGFGIEVVVKIIVDPSALEGRVKKLLQDRSHLEQLNQARKKEKELLDKIAILEKENRLLMAKKESSKDLKKQFQETSQGLTAIDWFDKAVSLWADGKYTDPQKAIEYLNETFRLNPNYSAAYLNRGAAYAQLEQYQQAISDYNEAIRLEPDDADGYNKRGSGYNNRGVAYSSLGQHQRAIQDYDQAIRLKTDYAYAYNRGLAYSRLKQHQQAIKDYDEAIRLKPDYTDAYRNRGFAYVNLGQYQRAIEDFDKAIRLKPDDADGYNNRGLIYQKLGQHQQAIKDYDEAIRLSPDDAFAYSGRAVAYDAMRIFERAIEDYSRAILLRPDYHDYISRGNVYGTLGQSKQAIRDFDQAILLKPDYAAAYFSRGLEYAGQDQYHLAIQDYDQAILLKPDYALAYRSRGLTYMISGNTPEGCSSLIRACELGDCKSYHSYKGKGICR